MKRVKNKMDEGLKWFTFSTYFILFVYFAFTVYIVLDLLNPYNLNPNHTIALLVYITLAQILTISFSGVIIMTYKEEIDDLETKIFYLERRLKEQEAKKQNKEGDNLNEKN